MELFKLSNKRYRQTIILITHDENIALQADRILNIEDGKIRNDLMNR
jgi:putative ABC transport system ATP-binding protein